MVLQAMGSCEKPFRAESASKFGSVLAESQVVALFRVRKEAGKCHMPGKA